jgi:hypothetical protein
MNLTKLFNTNKKNAFGVLLGLGLVVLVVVLVQYNSDKSKIFDGMTDNSVSPYNQPSMPSVPPSVPPMQSASTLSSESYLPVPGSSGQQSNAPAAMNLGPEDLLPRDVNSEWASINPASNDLQNINLLTAGQMIGINTVGTCLKNGNRQLLRPEPAIPKHETGPWNQSTNDCDDQYRRPDTW